MNKQELLDDIKDVRSWYQVFHFPYDVTVGMWDTDPKVAKLCEGIDLNGKTCIDVGCLEGAAALWMEKQGGIVSCFDIWDEVEPKIEIVRKYLGLKAPFKLMSIYDLEDKADVVLMMGVYYHLRHPLLGIEKAWEACNEYLLLEGEVMNGDDSFAYFYKDKYKEDPTNFWVPTVRCLEDWCWSLDDVESVKIIFPLMGMCRAGVVVKRCTH